MMLKKILIIFIFMILVTGSGLYFFSPKDIQKTVDLIPCKDVISLEDFKDKYQCAINNGNVFVFIPNEKKVEIKRLSDDMIVNTFYPESESDQSDFVFDYTDPSFDLRDINQDGLSDLMVYEYSGAYNQIYSFYIFDPQEGKYKIIENLQGIVNADFYEKDGDSFIQEFSKGRGLGDIYSSNTYKYNKNNKLYEKINNCERNLIEYSEEENGLYYTMCKELNNEKRLVLSTFIFDGKGNESMRECDSFDCKLIKHSAFIPKIDMIEKKGDWYLIDYIETGESSKGSIIEIPENKWIKIRGWLYKDDIPESIIELMLLK